MSTSSDSGATAPRQVAIMVAPNGARLTRQDHPAIPLTTSELVAAVAGAAVAGAHAVHLHVRDRQQQHILDAALYSEAIDAIARSQGRAFPVQITTEAVGRFSQAQQIDVVQKVRPDFASVAVREMAGEETLLSEASRFYHWCEAEKVALQHILYSARDLEWFLTLKERGVIPADSRSVLFVLGRYAPDQLSDTAMLDEFLQAREQLDAAHSLLWMLCAFGQSETRCLRYGAGLGGHVRVGFENNTLDQQGKVADSNAERVREVAEVINALQGVVTGCDNIEQVLGRGT